MKSENRNEFAPESGGRTPAHARANPAAERRARGRVSDDADFADDEDGEGAGLGAGSFAPAGGSFAKQPPPMPVPSPRKPRFSEKDGRFSPKTLGILFVAALALCMLSPINPFSNVAPGMDSSVFLTIANGMHHGKVPYLDFFDHKGPLLYLINYVGIFFGGRVGVWFIELLSMCVAVFFAYRTALLFTERYPALWGTLATVATAMTFFAQGNVPEEYAMPLIFASFFFYAEHLLKNEPLGRLKIFAIGACFGASLLLKPNLFTVWFVFSAVIVALGFLRGKYRDLVFYVLFFLIGAAAILAPFLLYLLLTGAFPEFIAQYIVFNRTYAAESVPLKTYLFNAFGTVNKAYMWLVFLAGLTWLVQRFNTRQRPFYIAYMLIVVMAVLIVSFSRFNFLQYSLVLVPLLTPAWAFFINAVFNGLGGTKTLISRYVVPGIAFVCIFNAQLLYLLGAGYLRIFPDGVNRNYVPLNDVRGVCSVIRKHAPNRNDKITVWGNACYFYYYSQRDSASRYIYQWPPANRDVGIAKKYEDEIIKAKPKLIIIPLNHHEAKDGFRHLTLPETPPRFLFERLVPLTATHYTDAYGARHELKDRDGLRKKYEIIPNTGYEHFVQIYKRKD